MTLDITVPRSDAFALDVADEYTWLPTKHKVIITILLLKLRIPRRAIRRLQHFGPAIPKQRTELEPLLPAAHRVYRSLVAQVYVLANSQAHRVLVRKDGTASGFRLADNVRRAHVVKEAIVDTA